MLKRILQGINMLTLVAPVAPTTLREKQVNVCQFPITNSLIRGIILTLIIRPSK